MSVDHGTFWASNAGCRCELCEDAREDRVRDYVAQRPVLMAAIRREEWLRLRLSSRCTRGGSAHKACGGWYGSGKNQREGRCRCECHTVTRS